jgi:hypothetical protein
MTNIQFFRTFERALYFKNVALRDPDPTFPGQSVRFSIRFTCMNMCTYFT